MHGSHAETKPRVAIGRLAGRGLRRVSMHGKMSEPLRETIEKAYDEAYDYYRLFEDESDRGLLFLPWRFSKSR